MNGFSATDMSTAAANGFRDGLAAQPAAAQEAWDTLSREWAINGMPADKQRLARAAFDAGRSAAPVAAAPVDARTLAMAVEKALGWRDGERDAELDSLLEQAMTVLDGTPAAPGIDLANEVESLRWQLERANNAIATLHSSQQLRDKVAGVLDASPKGYARTPKAGEQIADILIEWRRNEIDAGSALAAIEAHLDACTFQPANDLNIGYEAGMRLAREAQGASPNGVSQE